MCHEIVSTASYSGDIVNVRVAAIAGDKLTVGVRLGTTRRTNITLSPMYMHTVSVRKQFAQLLTNYSRISASCQGSNDSLHDCVAFVAGAADRRHRSCSAQTTTETRSSLGEEGGGDPPLSCGGCSVYSSGALCESLSDSGTTLGAQGSFRRRTVGAIALSFPRTQIIGLAPFVGQHG